MEELPKKFELPNHPRVFDVGDLAASLPATIIGAIESQSSETVPRMLNIHEVLSESKWPQASDSLEQEPHSYRADAPTYVAALTICKANSSSVSAFLRQCLIQLVREYRGTP